MKTVSTSRVRVTNFFRSLFAALVAAIVLSVSASAITITVEIGRVSRDCAGFGICSITIDPELGTNSARADGVLTGNQLTLSFVQPFGQPGQTLPIDEPIQLDPQTALALGANSVVILPGEYTIDYSTNPNGVVILPVQRIGVTIHVESGRRSKGCTGFGICSITIEIDLLRRPVPTVGTLEGDQLTLSFMQPFGRPGETLPIDEPIQLDPQTARALGAAQVVIQPGQYTIDYSTNPNGVVTLPVQRIGITINIEVGRRSMGCTRFGICSITIGAELLQRPVPTVGTIDGDVLTLDFTKAVPEREDVIIIDEDIVLDSATSRSLGIEQRVVKAGSYPVDYSLNPNGTVHLPTESLRPLGITIHVKIGLRSQGCRGFGICNIWISADAAEQTAPAVGDLTGNKLRIDFQSQLNEQGDALVIDEPVELDEETSLGLGARKVVLLPGTYPVDYSKNPNGSVEVNVGRIGITIGVDVGRRSRDCRGLGICSVWVEFDLRTGTTPTVASLKDSTLTLLFTSELPEQGDTFTIDENFELDAQVARMLGAKGLTIRAGSYVIRRDAKGRPYVELPVARIGITVTIYVGRGPSCTGFGICRITIETNFSARTAQAIATTSDGILELDFVTAAPEGEAIMYLDHGVTLDAETAAALGFGEILPGEYVMDYSSNEHGTVRLRTDNVSATVAPELTDAGEKAQAFPNPTKGATTLHFNVRRAGPVTVTLADARGAVVTRLVDAAMEAGEQSVSFDAGTLADGIYFYTINTVTGIENGRIIVMRR